MPLNISPNMYSGGAVAFQSTPHTQFMINLIARKAAKDEALDEYYQKRNSSITSEGVRSQDVPAFVDKVQKMQNFWTQNKDAIRNPTSDGGRAQMMYNNLYNDASTFPQISKTEELKKKPFIDLLADPDKRSRVTDKMVSDVASHDQPLMIQDENGRWTDNPNRKSFDITQETFNPKEFSTDDWQKYYKGIGEGITPNKNKIVTAKDPNDPYSNIVTTTTEYSPDQLKSIGDLAKNDYFTNNSLQYSFDKAHPFKQYQQDHPEQFGTLNAIHKSVYGADIKDDADLHAAIVLQKKIEPTLTAKKEDDFAARGDYNFNHQKQLEAIRFGHEKELASFRKSLGINENGEDDGLWVGGYIDNALKNGKPAQYYDKSSNKWIQAKEVGVNPILEQSLQVNGQSPDFIYALPNGEVKYGIYKRYSENDKNNPNGYVEENGKKVVDMTNVRTATKEDIKAAVSHKAGVKQMNKEMQEQLNSKGNKKSSKYDPLGILY